MEAKLEIPEIYQGMLEEYAREERVTRLTAFSNLMDLVQMKHLSMEQYFIVLDQPREELDALKELLEADIRAFYMSLFGEDSCGCRADCYFREEEDRLYLKLCYDVPMRLWEILENMSLRFPAMDVMEDNTVFMLYTPDILAEGLPDMAELKRCFEEKMAGDDGHGKSGYFESVYEEEEDDGSFAEEESETEESS